MRRLRSNHGLANSSQAKSTSKKIINKNNCSGKFESVSKYFKKENNSSNVNDEVKNQNCIESPYKDLVKDQKAVLNDTASEEGDFKTPIMIKKIRQITANKNNEEKKARKTKIKSKTRQTTLVKMLEKQFAHSEFNGEHVQMAVALSRSEQSEKNLNDNLESEGFLSTQEKVLNVRATLEQFGFKSGKDTGEFVAKETKRSKKSRFRFITPTLFIKTQEERDLETAKRISIILSESPQIPIQLIDKGEYCVSSNYLEKFLNFNSQCFFKSCFNNLKKEDFYVPILNLPQSSLKCGSLLKDWSKIPGRDKSPKKKNEPIQRSNNLIDFKLSESNGIINNSNKVDIVFDLTQDSDQEINCNEEQISIEKSISIKKTSFKSREISPDLFSSDDDDAINDEINNKKISHEIKDKSSQNSHEISPNNASCSLKPLEITLSPNILLKPKSIDNSSKKTITALSTSMLSNFKSLINTSDSESDLDTFKSSKGIDHFESFHFDGDEFAFNLSQRFNDPQKLSKVDVNDRKVINNFSLDDDLNSESSQSFDLNVSKNCEGDNFNKTINEISEMVHFEIDVLSQKCTQTNSKLTKPVFDLMEDSNQDLSNQENSLNSMNCFSFNQNQSKSNSGFKSIEKNNMNLSFNSTSNKSKIVKSKKMLDIDVVILDSEDDSDQEESRFKLKNNTERSCSITKNSNQSFIESLDKKSELQGYESNDKLSDEVFNTSLGSDQEDKSKENMSNLSNNTRSFHFLEKNFNQSFNDYEMENEFQNVDLNIFNDKSDILSKNDKVCNGNSQDSDKEYFIKSNLNPVSISSKNVFSLEGSFNQSFPLDDEMENELQDTELNFIKDKLDNSFSKNDKVFNDKEDSSEELNNQRNTLSSTNCLPFDQNLSTNDFNFDEKNKQIGNDDSNFLPNDSLFNLNVTEYIERVLNENNDNSINKSKKISNILVTNLDLTGDSDQANNFKGNESKLSNTSQKCSSQKKSPKKSLNLNDNDIINELKDIFNNDVNVLGLTEFSNPEDKSKANTLKSLNNSSERFSSSKKSLNQSSFNDYEIDNKLQDYKFNLVENKSDDKLFNDDKVFNLTQDSDQEMNSCHLSNDSNFFEHEGYCKININKQKFIQYLDKNDEDKIIKKSRCFNNDISSINDLISKPLKIEQKHFEELNLLEETFTPKKFRRSISSDQCKLIKKPTPKKFRKSLTFSSPSETKKTIPFYFNQIENVEKLSSTNSSIERNDSCESICISDEEINYSSFYSSPNKSVDTVDEFTATIENPINQIIPNLTHKRINELIKSSQSSIPIKPSLLPQIDETCPSTPERVVIKTRNITPMPNYDRMNTPTIAGELEKIGVKNLKRHRGVQILKHIYNSTHPIVDNDSETCDSDEDNNRCVKRRKNESMGDNFDDNDDGMNSENLKFLNQNNERVQMKKWIVEKGGIEIVGDIPESDELIFDRKPPKKIHSCALPLHIAWFNFLASNPEIKENVLLYVPLQLEVLYEMLKEQGLKYHIQDLLMFLDKKCITIRTNQQGGQKGYQKKNKN